jgi:hypothetical protein
MAVMSKFKLYDLARAQVPLSVAIGMVLHPHPEHAGYSPMFSPEESHTPEEFAGGIPIRQRPGITGPHTMSNGTGTFAQGTNTHYYWPVP